MSPNGLLPGGTGAVRPSFQLDVLRPDDLLVLRFEFFNLRPGDEDPAQVVRVDPAGDAFVVVVFPPQHVQEQVFFEPSPPGKPLAPPPVVAVAARESRLAFRVPADVAGLPLTLDALLDWNAWEPSLAANALPDPPTAEQLEARPRPRAPGPSETSIELPYRLMLSPTAAGRWAHARWPQGRDGRVELWHTRLAALGTVEGEADDHPVRAVWSPDLGISGRFARPSTWPEDLPQPLEPFQRGYIVRYSADFGRAVKGGFYPAAPAAARRLMLTALGGWLDVKGRWPVLPDPEPLGGGVVTHPDLKLEPDVAIKLLETRHLAEVLAITEEAGPANLGATRILADATLRNPIDIAFPREPAPSLGEVGWVQRTRGGRDEYVEFALPGLLWPLGHLASLIYITERKFEPASGRVGAYLRQRVFIKVTQPVRDYRASAQAFPHAGRELPFTTVRFATLVTPDLNPPPGKSGAVPPPFFPTVGVSETAYDFALLAGDHEDRPVGLTGPLLFVPFDLGAGIAGSIAKAAPIWAASPGPLRTATARPAPVAFAAIDRGREKSGITTATCHEIVWGVATATATEVPAGETSVLPAMVTAMVSVPALSQVAGSVAGRATVAVSYPARFLEHGFGGENASHLYLQTGGALPAAAAPERSGGVAAPSFGVEALSKAFGPVGDAAGIGAGTFDPGQFFPSAKLFGAIDLKTLIVSGAPWADPDEVYPPALRDVTIDQLRTQLDDPDVYLRVPVLAHREVLAGGLPVATETLYAWKPEITPPPKTGVLSLEFDGGAELVLSVSGYAPLAGAEKPSSRVEGRLTHFKLDFAEVIEVTFAKFAFKSNDGERLDVNVEGVGVVFQGALSFVQTVQSILDPSGFSDPPFLTVLPTGITAGYTLDVPTLGIGVVSIEGLVLAASVSLPFTGDPAGVRFAISSREHPFLVTVALFGGGGFFAFAVTTSGPPQVEAAIEFGGNFSLDIGVASGNVHVMAGIYFKMLGSQVKLSGYLRLGGSVCVLGIVTISVEFYLALTYDDGKAYGEATLTVSVDVFGISQSVPLHMEKKFAGAAGDPTFAQLVEPPAWHEYCDAFAPLPA